MERLTYHRRSQEGPPSFESRCKDTGLGGQMVKSPIQGELEEKISHQINRSSRTLIDKLDKTRQCRGPEAQHHSPLTLHSLSIEEYLGLPIIPVSHG